MAEDVPRRNLIESRIIADIVTAGQILGERRIEVELSGIDQLEKRIGEDRLAQRSGLKDRVLGDRHVRGG